MLSIYINIMVMCTMYMHNFPNGVNILLVKVAGETETKGQIKLRFKTAAGKDVVCTRSFQLTQKASKMK